MIFLMAENQEMSISDSSSGSEKNEVRENSSLMTQIEEILNLPDDPEVISDYIKQRKEALGKNPIRTLAKNNMFFKPIVGGFFDDEMTIQPGIFEDASFSVNDDKIYEDVIKNIKGYSKFLQTHLDGNYHQLALIAVQNTTTYYFGNIQPSTEQQAIRAEKFDFFRNENVNYSIADSKESALCAERAAVAHNLLLFCGDSSLYVGGYLNEVWEGGGSYEEMHSYLLTQNSDGKFDVFDPTNPTLRFTDINFQQLSIVVPYTLETNSGEIPQQGQQFKGQYSYQYMENGEKKSQPQSVRTYTIGPKNK